MKYGFSGIEVYMYTLNNIVTGSNWGWYLEARPSFKYISPGESATIACYNTSSTNSRVLPHDSYWYWIMSNGTLQQLSTDINERIRSDGSQLRISSATIEDDGFYCCKGPMQALDACNESAVLKLMVIMPPLIVPGQNKTVLVGCSATIECIIEDFGNPPFVVNRWQKSGQRLVTNGRKYSSQLIGNRMFLTIVNSTTDDKGYYWCILETSTFEIIQTSVHLSVKHSMIAHNTGSCNGVSYCNYAFMHISLFKLCNYVCS